MDVVERLIAAPGENILVNCGYGYGHSVLEVLDAVDRVGGVRLRRVSEGRRAGDPPALVAASGRIRDQLAWTPAYDQLDTIVGHALAWERGLAARRN